MRLAYVTVAMPTGSAEAFLIEEALELQRRVGTFVVIPRSPVRAIANRDAIALHANTVSVNPFSPWCLFASIFEIMRSPVKVIHAIGILFLEGPAGTRIKNIFVIPKALWLARYVRRNGIQHIHCHWAATTATMCMVASMTSGVPWSLTLHRGDIVANNLLGRKLREAAFARFISKSGQALARRIDPCVSMERAVVIPMGVKLPAVSTIPPDGMAMPPAPWIVLCPANLLPVKGHRYLIDAFAKCVKTGLNAELWIAGNGPLRNELVARVEQAGTGHAVKFLGNLAHDRLMNFYYERRISAVVLSSIDLGGGEHEGIPVALLEAMSFGVPVISTMTGGIPELIAGEAGILVNPADDTALSKALLELFNNGAQYKKISAAGRSIVEQRFGVVGSVDRLLRQISGSIAYADS